MSNKAEGRTKQNTAAGRLLTFFSPVVESVSGKPISAFVQASQPKGGRGGGRAPQGSTERSYQELFDRLAARDNPQGAQGSQGATNRGGTQGATAKPKPVAKTQVAKGINTNTKQEIETKNSEFSTGERTKGIFNIGRFRAEVSGADSILPTHSFLTVFAPMPWAIKKFPAGNLDSLLTMRCDNVVLPSINLLQEQNIRRYGFGPVENVAYGVNVGDFTLQFIVDKDALVIEFFEEWLNLIVNRDSFGGANMNNNKIGGLRRPYEIAYKDTYACPNVNVFVYDRSQNAVMEYHIYDVFPTGIQSMNMSWSEENTLMKLSVTFSFTDLRIQQSAEKDKAGVGFGSSVDMRKKALLKALEADAQIRGGDFSGTGSAPFDQTPGAIKLSGDGDDGAQFNSVFPVQPDTFPAGGVELEGRPKQRDAFGNEITPLT
jgi:hypothetical protein